MDAIELIKLHTDGTRSFTPITREPIDHKELITLNIGHRSHRIDEILVKVFTEGLSVGLREGLRLEAEGVGEAIETVDCDIGMTNFMQNGPRIPALFLHE